MCPLVLFLRDRLSSSPLCDIEGVRETKSPMLELEPQTFSSPEHLPARFHSTQDETVAFLFHLTLLTCLCICWLIVGSHAARKWSKP